jgi:hypothetical protein
MTVARLRRERIDGVAIDADLQPAFADSMLEDLTARGKTRCDSAWWTNAVTAAERGLHRARSAELSGLGCAAMTNSLLTPALHSGEACGRMYVSHESPGWSREGRATTRAAGEGCRRRVPATGGHACGQSPAARIARSRERGTGNPNPFTGESSLPSGGPILLQPESARRSKQPRLAARPSSGLAACRAPLRRSRGTQSRRLSTRGIGHRDPSGPSRRGDRPT